MQAIPTVQECASQTDWKYPRNATTQYEPRQYDEEKQKEILESEDVSEFAKNVAPRYARQSVHHCTRATIASILYPTYIY